MVIANNKTPCFICNEEKITYPCKGCLKEFCFMDLAKHKQILNDELNHIINDYGEFKLSMNEQKQNPQNRSLIKQIDQWEMNLIGKIKQKANDCREIVLKSSHTFIDGIEMKFNDLSEQIQELQKENDFNEINLNYLSNQLRKIREELNNPPKTSIQQNSQPFITDISIISSIKPKWDKLKQNAITVAGGNGQEQKLNQLNQPVAIFIDETKNIFIADSYNHRIVEWRCDAKEGQTTAGGNGKGNRIHQLNLPTDVIVDQLSHSIIIADHGNRRVIEWLNQKQQLILIHNIDCSRLAIDKYGFLYVSDCKKNEVRRWKIGKYNNEGIIVAGGNGEGSELNQLNHPGFIFVDGEQSVYVSDAYNNRVIKWRKGATKGIVVAGGNGQGENLDQLFHPRGVIIDDLGQIYVADFENHRIMRWCEGKEEGEIVVGGNGKGNQLNQFNGPAGLSFHDEGILYVADRWNHRIAKFDIIL
ncbi:unnamed protein product [Adineta steineri]|uniref:Uncharacterized protein n=1 Tax=Adineta steineri TaxID=433720 RepID=A0A815QL10_9BILA|nr:unnamed protein product [Adineta steineri]CAF1633956.1 unnamed protein product [Adineta steineri]